MPQRGKSRRTAARQTQLGQRKRRQTRGPSGTPAGSEPRPAIESVSAAAEGVSADVTSIPQPSSQRQSSPRAAEARPAVYAYVAPELRRILTFSGATLAILVALTFVLR